MANTDVSPPLEQPVRFLKGVGPKRAELLGRLGVWTVRDLLHYYPRRHEDRREITPVRRLKINQVQTVEGEVLAMGQRRSQRGVHVFELALGDSSGVIHAVWFNQPYLRNFFKVGDRYILHGKVTLYKKVTLLSPEYEKVEASDEGEPIHTHRIVPIYGLTESLGQRFLRGLQYRVCREYAAQAPEILPDGLRQKLALDPIDQSLEGIHFPETPEQNERARRRLIFQEFFLLQMALVLRRQSNASRRGLTHAAGGELLERFKDLVPFDWTEDQRKAIGEIEQDMTSGRLMNRLLQGEVGIGKTLVALYAAVLTIQNKFQAALMAPTEILAEQHFLTAKTFLEPLGVHVALLISSLPQPEKARIVEEIKEGRLDLLIGTHALIQKSIAFARLGLVVIDEQHKFGVDQRSQLQKKAGGTHSLVLTATPIPRTLALTVYGDLDVSTMQEKTGRGASTQTLWLREGDRERVYQFLEEEVSQGHQAYIVYPIIRASSKTGLKSAIEEALRLSKERFPHRRLGLLHGELSSREKQALMESFRTGGIDILVATSMVEVGLDIPNATVMVVEEAHRFGLSQLHQLRGRIGRGQAASTFILLCDAPTRDAQTRLQTLERLEDGFRIAEEDLALRGPGEFFGMEQSGLPELRLGDLARDVELMALARREAEQIVLGDPRLEDSCYALLKREIGERFSRDCFGV